MYKPCLFANYRILTPLISHLQPRQAYAVLRTTGTIGKPLERHTSYLFDYPAAPTGIDAAMRYLKIERPQAEAVINNFFLLETRLELENTWLSRKRGQFIHQIIDPGAIGQISRMIQGNGPMLLLSGHTTYYFMILWALHLLGHKMAFMMVDPRSSVRDNAIMQDSVIRSADALAAVMPVLFANEGGTISKTVELLKNGYTVLMLADIPGYQKRGKRVRMFQEDFWVPSGVLRIREEAAAPAAFVFSYTAEIDQPYQVAVSSVIYHPDPVDLQQWASELESTVRKAPGSWFGWFILKDMI